MNWSERVASILRSLHWRRGLRAGFAVASAMIVCRLLGRPMGWAALGGFEAVLVDNGGPYRSRMYTIGAVLFGGAACGLIGSLLPSADSSVVLLAVSVVATALVCFGVTFARVAAQPIANTSVIILVLYFAGFGSVGRTLEAALANVTAYVLGGLWAAVLSLLLWPVDPFRPARLEVASCYELLARFAEKLARPHHDVHDDDHGHSVELKRQIRARFELARAALGATPARAPARTVRARSLSVLLETADLLFATTFRLSEFAEAKNEVACRQVLEEAATWLSSAERAIARALQERPADSGESFGPEGSHRVQHIVRPSENMTRGTCGESEHSLLPHILAEENEALQNLEIGFDAVRSVWTGIELVPGEAARRAVLSTRYAPAEWVDSLEENWTLQSTMMRHSLRMAVVGAVDVLLMHTVHVTHGFWLAMTSIIVLQPYSSGTLRKSLQRVGGTIGGGFLAALLAAVIHSYGGIIAVITICSVLTLATYAVDYGWYSFFLTPTFVLMSLPYLRDWRYAGVRIFTTLLGAVAAVLAMRLLWPESLRVEFGRLLARSATTADQYLTAVLRFWEVRGTDAIDAERTLLAPARRACGLSSQDAEEALDRAMLEPLPEALHLNNGRGARASSPVNESVLTFTTYIRRFTQCLTTLAAVGEPSQRTVRRMHALADRLEGINARLTTHPGNGQMAGILDSGQLQGSVEGEGAGANPAASLAEQMLSRMERQAGILERASTGVVAGS